METPPIPMGQLSSHRRWVGWRNTMLFIDMPLFAFVKNVIHRWRYLFSVLFKEVGFLPHLLKRFLNVCMKWRNNGIMVAAWLRRPMVVSSSSCVVEPSVIICARSFVHSLNLSSVSATVNFLVLIAQPTTVLTSSILPSALSFIRDNRSSLGRGSGSMMGRPRTCIASGTAWEAR